MSDTVRKYGNPPHRVAVLHGGPGAPGYMAPVARELAKTIGVIEPLQTRDSVFGQIDELIEQLSAHADKPLTLIGSSWGAVLALFAAARNEVAIAGLILIGSAVFDAENSAKIEGLRLERLAPGKRDRYHELMSAMKSAEGEEADSLMDEWGSLFFDTDVYDPITRDLEVIEVQYELHKKVWADFVTMRDRQGYLKTEFSRIKVPVTVIHGEYDPHPIEGIRPFLQSCIDDIRFHILPDCGHYPWIERKAKDRFFRIIKTLIS
ncbi:MAG: alpha/beta hydrolase [candidate division Zixibacteria bacterium]